MHSSLSQLPQQAVGTASAPRRRLTRLGGGRLCVRAGSEGSDSASQQARQVTYEQALEVRLRVQGWSCATLCLSHTAGRGLELLRQAGGTPAALPAARVALAPRAAHSRAQAFFC